MSGSARARGAYNQKMAEETNLLCTLNATRQFIANLNDSVMDKSLVLKHLDAAIKQAEGI